MGDDSKDAYKEENKQLRAKVAELEAALSDARELITRQKSAGLESPMKRAAERDRLAAELHKFKDEAEARLAERNRMRGDLNAADAELQKLRDDTEELINSLGEAEAAFHEQDSPGSEEGYNRRRGVLMALSAVDKFVLTRGAGQLRLPLYKLKCALGDASRGISNSLTEPAKSKRGRMGRPLPIDMIVHKSVASFTVSALITLKEKKKKAYDIVAAASGLPRVELMRFRQDLNARKRRAPKEALRQYDILMYDWAKRIKEGAPESNLKRQIKVSLNELREMRNRRDFERF